MAELLTPKRIACALGVSESSVKRWCDQGTIPTQYTGGGHRRVHLSDLLTFVRKGKYSVLHPESLGLPVGLGDVGDLLEASVGPLLDALFAGDEQACRQVVINAYLSKHSVGSICDDLLAVAFRKIGHQWVDGAIDIFQERQSCEIVLRILHEIRHLKSPSNNDAPLAVGCPAPGDPYLMGSAMAELVLREADWRTISLGANLPFSSLKEAILNYRPKLFWLSCSSIPDPESFQKDFLELIKTCGDHCTLAIGGRAIRDPIASQLGTAVVCGSMKQLEQTAEKLRSPLVK